MYKKLFLLVIVLTILFILLTYMKSHMLYHPMPAVVDKYDRFYQKLLHLTESKDYITNVFVKTSDNILLDTVYIKNPDSNKCIIFFHGNAGNLSMRFDMIKFLYNYASVLIFDYRSFGRSSGDQTNLSSYGLNKDAEAIWNFATRNLGLKSSDLSLFGESLGCSVVIYLAANLSKSMDTDNYPHSLILNSPFFSLSSMIEIMFHKINIGFVGKIMSMFMGREYKSNEWIGFINHHTKIIIAHSPRDEIIPYKESTNLFNLISQTHKNVKFITITGTHNNLGLTDNYIYALADLFND
ncbi:putative peptidase S9 [Tupanvirus soda lake]|uniref:Peptidase S9 n=2 Tax=Tupanvirus TaxID=2094720 RepID=A0AC62AAM7_9VIRU|nr:putative peptidase S9 [Tupanvirus soda lake]QKU34836.1 putative peptidase S9 [Tupanvirus soda lake]